MSMIVVMDIGKTNAKLCVVDGVSGVLVSTTSMQTPTIHAQPYPHLDTDAILSLIHISEPTRPY